MRKIFKANIFIILFISIFLSCSPKYNIINLTKSVERLDVTITDDDCALMRTVFSNVYIKYINSTEWNQLMESKTYVHEKSESYLYRIPKLILFQIIVKNTGKHPLFLENIKLKYGDKTADYRSLDEITDEHKSPIYSLINFKALTSYRRLLSDNYCREKIDYDKNTTGYKFKFISPSDTIIYYTAFQWIPVEYREYKIVVSLKYAGTTKNLIFDFKRHEYRTVGKHFLNPLKDEK